MRQMPITLAYVTPDVLRWARESVGLSTHEAAAQLKIYAWQLELAESGDELLTFRQVERLAEIYDRPLAVLFMPEPPAEEPPEAQFRRLPGAPELPWPAEMRRLARRIRSRQDAATELYEALEQEPRWSMVARRFRDVPPGALAVLARQLLGVTDAEQIGWEDTSGYAPLRAWVDAAEGLGVLVMQDGSMDLETMRGFASLHATVPAIVVNTKDDPRARAFTVIHELGHLVWVASGREVGAETETWCNEFAAEILMPREAVASVFAGTSGTLDDRTAEVALSFGVTQLAAAVRIARLGLMNRENGDELVAAIRRRPPRQRSRGGNYYRTKITRLGPAFTQLVLNGVDDQVLTLSSAAGLLEAKVNQFERLRETLNARTEFG